MWRFVVAIVPFQVPNRAHLQSDHSEASDSESEFEADEEELAEVASSDDASDFNDSNASGSDDASGSDFGGDDESDEGRFKSSITDFASSSCGHFR